MAYKSQDNEIDTNQSEMQDEMLGFHTAVLGIMPSLVRSMIFDKQEKQGHVGGTL